MDLDPSCLQLLTIRHANKPQEPQKDTAKTNRSKMTTTVSSPPPSLSPPKDPKKRKNLTIKISEFDAWSGLKGEMSWTAIMQFVRTEYLRLREVRPVIVRGGNVEGIKRLPRIPTQPVRKVNSSQAELMQEMKKIFSEVKDIKSILKPPPKKELERIESDRRERMKDHSIT